MKEKKQISKLLKKGRVAKTNWLDPFYTAIWTFGWFSGRDSDPLFTDGSTTSTLTDPDLRKGSSNSQANS
jgi:hypothetical protein